MALRKGEAARADISGRKFEPTTNTVQTPDDSSTNAVQTPDEHRTLSRYDVRMDPADWHALGKLARSRGASRGAIIRELVKRTLHQR